MAQRAENRVQHRVQVLAEVFGQKPQHEIAALLKQLILASISPVGDPVGEMLRTIQLHCHVGVRTKEIHFKGPCTIKRDGQFRIDSEPSLRRGERFEPPEEKCLGRTPCASDAISIGRYGPRHVNEETRER